MNLRQLEAFRATMRTGSITGAAKLMNISQPSVSRLIGDLERSLGFALFVRSGRGLVSTVEARRFFQGVEGMFLGGDRLGDLAETIRTTPGDVISLGVIPALSTVEVPEAVAELSCVRPDAEIMLSVRNTPAIIDAVQMQQLDLGLVGRHAHHEGVETLYQTSLPYVCLIPESHDLDGGQGPIDLSAIDEEQALIALAGVYTYEMMEMDPAIAAKLRAQSRIAAANMPVAAALVRETGALAIVDPVSAGIACGRGGVVSRPIVQNMRYHLGLITRGRESLSMDGHHLAELLMARLARL